MGDSYKVSFEPLEHAGGISPEVLRVSDLRAPTHHVYFTQRSFTPDDRSRVVLSRRDERAVSIRIRLSRQAEIAWSSPATWRAPRPCT
jgi:hypothetical protein